MGQNWRHLLWEKVRASTTRTQVEIAEEIGASQGTLSRWLNGKASPKWKSQVQGLARYLGLPEDDLWAQIDAERGDSASKPNRPKVLAEGLTTDDKLTKIVALGALALDLLQKSEIPPERYADALERMADIARWLVRADVPAEDVDSVLVTLQSYAHQTGSLPRSLADYTADTPAPGERGADLSLDDGPGATGRSQCGSGAPGTRNAPRNRRSSRRG